MNYDNIELLRHELTDKRVNISSQEKQEIKVEDVIGYTYFNIGLGFISAVITKDKESIKIYNHDNINIKINNENFYDITNKLVLSMKKHKWSNKKTYKPKDYFVIDGYDIELNVLLTQNRIIKFKINNAEPKGFFDILDLMFQLWS